MQLMKLIPVKNRTVFIFFSLIGLIVYLNSLNVPFHYDDIYYLKENLGIKSVSLFWNRVNSDIFTALRSRPFLLFTFLINYKLGGLDTFGYHLLNLLIHIGNAFLIYIILQQYAASGEKRDFSLKFFLASLLFLIHPINTESVTYLSSRSSELSAFFVLLAMYLFFRATAHGFRGGYYLASMISFLLGLMTKEAAIIFPALLLLFDLFFVSQGFQKLRERFKYHVPHLLALCAVFAAYASLISTPVLDADRSWMTHILTEQKVFAQYFKLLAVPLALNIDHDILPAAVVDSQVLVSMLVLFALFAAAILAKKNNRLISFSLFWCFINLAPFLVIQLNDFMAERWVYLASIGFCIGLAEGLMLLSINHQKTAVVVISVLVLTYGSLTVARNHVYTSPVLLWADTAAKSPGKYRPLLNLSSAYMENGNTHFGIAYAEEAIRQWKKRGARNKDIVVAYLNIASAQGLDPKRGEALLQTIDKAASQDASYYATQGALFLNEGKHQKALGSFIKALELSPQSAAYLFLVGECYEILGHKQSARQYFSRATGVTPQTAQEYMAQGESFSKLGNYQKASDAFDAALLADPLDVTMQVYYATIMLHNGFLDKAAEHFSTALKLSPVYAPAYKGMGLVMLQKGQAEKALGYFERALELLPQKSVEWKTAAELRDEAREDVQEQIKKIMSR